MTKPLHLGSPPPPPFRRDAANPIRRAAASPGGATHMTYLTFAATIVNGKDLTVRRRAEIFAARVRWRGATPRIA